MILCKNCENKFSGNYCNICGQDAQTERITFNSFLYEFQYPFLKFNKNIFYTIKGLTITPGYTLQNYLKGKRVKHYRPFLFVFMMGLLLSFLTHYLPLNRMDINNRFENIMHVSAEKSNITLPVMYFVFAIFSWSFYLKAGLNIFEHLIINAFLTGQIAFFSIVIFPILYFFNGTSINSYLILAHILVIQILYPAWAYYKCFVNEYPGYMGILRSIGCSLIGTLVPLLIYNFYPDLLR